MLLLLSILDFVPCALFLFAAISLQRDLYNKMSKGCFAVFSTGTIMIICAGTLKAVWKILYYSRICDFTALNTMFFPLQTLGFVLSGVGIVSMICARQGSNTAYAVFVPPAVFSGTMIFVSLMIAGLTAIVVGLSRLASKLRRKRLIVLFVLCLFFELAMGYLSSRDSSSITLNWIEESVNVLGMLCLFLGARGLHKAGLSDLKLR